MNKVRKKIIWIVCLLAVLTMGVTTVKISKADRLEQREIVEYLLREFERVHKWDKNSKGKLVLQRKYLKREKIY